MGLRDRRYYWTMRDAVWSLAAGAMMLSDVIGYGTIVIPILASPFGCEYGAWRVDYRTCPIIPDD